MLPAEPAVFGMVGGGDWLTGVALFVNGRISGESPPPAPSMRVWLESVVAVSWSGRSREAMDPPFHRRGGLRGIHLYGRQVIACVVEFHPR